MNSLGTVMITFEVSSSAHGAGALRIDYAAATMTVMGEVFNKGDIVTIDGATGEALGENDFRISETGNAVAATIPT